MNADQRAAYDEAAKLEGERNARNLLRTRALAIIAEYDLTWNDSAVGDDAGDERCRGCSHISPRHDSDCPVLALAMRCAEAETPRLL